MGAIRPEHSTKPGTERVVNDSILTLDSSPQALVERVQKFGVAAIPGCINVQEFSAFLLGCVTQVERVFGCDFEDLTKGQGEVPEIVSISPEWVGDQDFVRKLVSDPTVHDVVAMYLGASPVLTSVECWLSLPSPKALDAGSAQQWHWDCDHVKWIKVFVYLNDVTTDNGAHMFVARSHSSMPVKTHSSRIDDGTLRKSVEAEDIWLLTGPAGTLIFEDTRGLHRGAPLTEGFRFALQLEFSLNSFGRATS